MKFGKVLVSNAMAFSLALAPVVASAQVRSNRAETLTQQMSEARTSLEKRTQDVQMLKYILATFDTEPPLIPFIVIGNGVILATAGYLLADGAARSPESEAFMQKSIDAGESSVRSMNAFIAQSQRGPVESDMLVKKMQQTAAVYSDGELEKFHAYIMTDGLLPKISGTRFSAALKKAYAKLSRKGYVGLALSATGTAAIVGGVLSAMPSKGGETLDAEHKAIAEAAIHEIRNLESSQQDKAKKDLLTKYGMRYVQLSNENMRAARSITALQNEIHILENK